jgi:hypothetical protein
VSVPQSRHCGTTLSGRNCHACGEDALPPESSWTSRITEWQPLVRTIRSLWPHSNGWPMAIAKALVVIAFGMVIDTLMSVLVVGISLRLA